MSTQSNEEEIEKINVDFVRERLPDVIHIDDPCAEAAMRAGKLVFDVTAGGKKIEAKLGALSLQRHGIDLPYINGLINGRRIYLAISN